MPNKLDPEERRARRNARNRAWTAAHREQRLAYWKERAANRSPEEREYRRAWQRNYYLTHKDKYRASNRKWSRDNRLAIKVRRALGVSTRQARQLLEVRP